MGNEITLAGDLIQIISQSRQNALRKVNEELINLVLEGRRIPGCRI